ncbi:hypothetical protein [Paenibacillus elgii]|uniref:hypothetical protein n=1 Tax=Paenibacillus elgii TaxID=189691 RepID=UPI0013D1B005|nr:hypothetical protein [Paenibacillus elgii]
MRIFSKKALQFDHPTNAEKPVVVQLNSFADVPDWVQHSTMFQFASSDESVLVIYSKQDEVVAEMSSDPIEKATKPRKGAAKGKPEAEPSDEGDTETTTEPAADQPQEQQ